MLGSAQISQIVEAALVQIGDDPCADSIRQLLVQPRCELREWDYGTAREVFYCWIVLEHQPSNTCIAYCEQGFGPSCPWGLLSTRGPSLSLGTDSQWFTFLEDAFRESPAWNGANPIEYEIR